MDQLSDAWMQPSFRRLGLDDDELLVAASYLQGVESLAIVRCKVFAGTAAMLFSHYATRALLETFGPDFSSARQLLDVLRNCALVASVLILLLSILAGLFMIRELRHAVLPDETKRYLRRRSASMEAYVLGRFIRRSVAWLRVRS